MAVNPGLRSDSRQWLIYDDEVLGAVMRALEAFALHIAGGPLSRHRRVEVRAVGHLMRRVAESRIVEMERADGAQRVAVHHLRAIFDWLGAEQRGLVLPPPAVELDEIHAAVFRLDSRAQSAGIGGPGVHRAAVRGD